MNAVTAEGAPVGADIGEDFIEGDARASALTQFDLCHASAYGLFNGGEHPYEGQTGKANNEEDQLPGLHLADYGQVEVVPIGGKSNDDTAE